MDTRMTVLRAKFPDVIRERHFSHIGCQLGESLTIVTIASELQENSPIR
jgi:hypothetical protein